MLINNTAVAVCDATVMPRSTTARHQKLFVNLMKLDRFNGTNTFYK